MFGYRRVYVHWHTGPPCHIVRQYDNAVRENPSCTASSFRQTQRCNSTYCGACTRGRAEKVRTSTRWVATGSGKANGYQAQILSFATSSLLSDVHYEILALRSPSPTGSHRRQAGTADKSCLNLTDVIDPEVTRSSVDYGADAGMTP